jgi:hypothetical protein
MWQMCVACNVGRGVGVEVRDVAHVQGCLTHRWVGSNTCPGWQDQQQQTGLMHSLQHCLLLMLS